MAGTRRGSSQIHAVPCLRAMMTAPPVPHFRAAGALAFVHSHVSSEPRFPDGLTLLTALRKPVPERISFHRNTKSVTRACKSGLIRSTARHPGPDGKHLQKFAMMCFSEIFR